MSNTVAYIIFGIVLLHLIVGFVWLMIKFNKKPEKQKKGE